MTTLDSGIAHRRGMPSARAASREHPSPATGGSVGKGWGAFGALIVALIWLATTITANAALTETSARQAILIDMTTDTILFEKNADERMPTSSMGKIMTIYMVYEALDDGRLSLDDEFRVSEKAWRKGGSKMFVDLNSTVSIEDLLRGVIVQSGNDASIVLAEGMAGSEAAFAAQMTEKARELGMMNSNFANSSGWPDPDHYSTARDLAILSQRLIEDFPDLYHLFAETEFTYNDISQGNRNPLLYRNVNADGLKTGHTSEAGYGLVASAVRDGRRLVMVVNGIESSQERANASERLIEWGFREFDTYGLFAAGETVQEAEVWRGDQATVPLVARDDISVTMTRDQWSSATAHVEVDEPVHAPIAAGDPLGRLVLTAPDFTRHEVPLVAGTDVGEAGLFSRMWQTGRYLVLGN